MAVESDFNSWDMCIFVNRIMELYGKISIGVSVKMVASLCNLGLK